VGFKWFVPDWSTVHAVSAAKKVPGRASCLDGTAWATDKDGPIMDLLAAEITARTDKDPASIIAN